MSTSSTITSSPSPLEYNAFLETQELLQYRSAVFSDTEMDDLMEGGLDVVAASKVFMSSYEGSNRFILQINSRLNKNEKLGLTKRQIRAVLNVLLGETRPEFANAIYDGKVRGELDVNLNGTYLCGRDNDNGTCQETFDNLATFYKHLDAVHDMRPSRGSVHKAFVAPEEILERPDETGLDFLGVVPRGCYAVPDATAASNGGFRFLKVHVLKKDTHRNRRFVYGRKITGSMVLPRGTMEVREWESDRKELIGFQEPGYSYQGKLDKLLGQISETPEAYATLFATMKGHCGVCGKTLTTEISRALGIGPDCEKRFGDLKSYMQQFRLYRS